MGNRKIDELRQQLGKIGERQRRYIFFFPPFADRLVEVLGDYFGDPKAVALTTAYDEYDFETLYRHEGLGFENGKYRIPVMVRLGNLKDDGCSLYRFRLFCSLSGDVVEVQIDSGKSVSLPNEAENLQPLLLKVFEHMQQQFSESSFFGGHTSYQDTRIGFNAGQRI